jgi:hypothetical protein
MKARVFSSRQHLEVLEPVIKLVAVLVVNLIAGRDTDSSVEED